MQLQLFLLKILETNKMSKNTHRPKRKRTAVPAADAPTADAAPRAPEAPVEKVRRKPGPKPGSKHAVRVDSRNNRKSPMTDGPGLKGAEAPALARLREENARLREQIPTEQPAKPAGDQSEQVQLAVAAINYARAINYNCNSQLRARTLNRNHHRCLVNVQVLLIG